MTGSKWLKVLGVMIALVVVTTACGGGDEESAASAATSERDAISVEDTSTSDTVETSEPSEDGAVLTDSSEVPVDGIEAPDDDPAAADSGEVA